MKNYIIYSAFAICLLWGQASFAQIASPSSVWIQVEAQPDRASALENFEQYKANFDNVVGFDIGAGWFGIALGPYQEKAADRVLQEFLSANLVPRSSFITTGTSYQRQIFPLNEARIEPTQNKVYKAPFIDTAPNQDTATAALALVPDIAPDEDTASSLKSAFHWATNRRLFLRAGNDTGRKKILAARACLGGLLRKRY